MRDASDAKPRRGIRRASSSAGQPSQRGLDTGLSGPFRSPEFEVPAAAYTAASLRFITKEVNGNVASGRTVIS